MIVLYYLARVNYSRGKRHGEAQWQKDHRKQKMPKESKKKRSRLHRAQMAKWRKVSRVSESSLDGQKNFADTWTTSRTIDISCSAWHQRKPVRIHHLPDIQGWRDDDRQAGPMRTRKDFKSTTQALTDLRQEQEPQNSFFSEERESTAKTIRWSIASRPGMTQPKLENLPVANFLFVIFTTMVSTWTPRHSMARSKLVERAMATDSFHLCLYLPSNSCVTVLIPYFLFSLSRRLERVVQQCCLFVPIRQNSLLPVLPCLVSVVSPTHSRWLKPSVFKRSVLYIPRVMTSLSAC